MKEFIKTIHNIREKNNCNHIEIYGNPTVLAKLPKDLKSEDIKLHEISCDNDAIYILPALSQPMKYVIENKENVIFEE